MKSNNSKSQFPFNLKLIFLSLFLAILLVLIIRSGFIPQQTPLDVSETNRTTLSPVQDPSPTCSKAPASLANAIVLYATTYITPQQTFEEISASARVLERKSPCNFLVFGVGYDSLLWTSLNFGGRTVFLENDQTWMDRIKEQVPSLEVYYVSYDTKVHEADELLRIGTEHEACKFVTNPRESKCRLTMRNLPSELYEIEWDLIMVDAPIGYHDDAPGRMSPIYTAGLMARNRERGETHVFVHNVERAEEDKFSKAFLCQSYFTEHRGKIGHFTIPSHRTRFGSPFCP